TDAAETLDLSRLIRFLQHPVKGFFTTRLRLMLLEENRHEDEETFSLAGLEQWQVRDTLIQRALQDRAGSPQEELALLEARGVLPHGAMARFSFNRSLQQANALLEGLQDYRKREPEAISLSLDCRLPNGSVQVLSAQIPTYYPGLGLLHCSPSSLRAKTLLPAWLEHLALCATGTLRQGEFTLLVCRDERRRFPCLPQQEALDILIDCVALYREGLTRPLPLFPGASACLALDASDKT